MKTVGYALGQGLVALLQLGFRTLGVICYMLAVLIRPIIEQTWGRQQRQRASRRAGVETPVTTEAADPQPGCETVTPAGAHPGHDFEAADQIVSMRLDPAVGVVNLRIFQARGVIKRDLIISEPRLRALMKARRHSFPDVPYEPAQGLEATKEEAIRLAERLINELGQQSGAAVRTGRDRGSRAGVSALPAPAPGQSQDPAEPARPRPGQASLERHHDIAALPARRLSPAFVGELVKAGSTRITPPDRPPFEVFEATLALDNGSELALRGAELERELSASGCEIGQRIEITPMGKVPVTLANGIEAQKNLYRVRPAAAPAEGVGP